jgi:hypothetical protein
MTDYDAPRQRDVDEADEPVLSDLKTRRTEGRSGVSDVGETEVAESDGLAIVDTPGWVDDEVGVFVPRQADEFVCGRCFLVRHQSRLARSTRRERVCSDCA